jgi:4-amino-4-deoxy-L-arabinose transferase-like glycosyltransferase
MDTFLRVGRQILSGDLLARDPYHPLHSIYGEVADAKEWQNWYAPHAFRQAPGYYYILAMLLKLFGGSLVAIKVLQVIMGAAHAVLLAAVGEKIMGRTGGLMAGLLAAVYGPFIAVEPLLLREGTGLFVATLGLYLVLRCLEQSDASHSTPPWRSVLAAGFVLGLGALIKETGLVLFAAILLWSLGRGRPGQPSLGRTAAPLLLCGFTLALTPLMLRNAAAGAPVLALSSMFPFNFAMANAADAPAGGVLFVIPPSFRGIIDRSAGQLLPTIVATLKTYEGNAGLFVAHLWAKFSAIWSNVELADNFSYDYFSLHSIVLSSLPRFVCVWLPAVIGLTLLSLGWRSTVPFPARAFRLLAVILCMHVLAQSLAPVMSRYRLVLVPFLILLAAWTLAQAVVWVGARRWPSVGGLLAGCLTVWLLWFLWPSNPLLWKGAIRAGDFAIGAMLLGDQRGLPASRAEFDRGLAYFQARGETDEEIALRRERLLYFVSRGRFPEVQEDWELVRLMLPPDDPIVQRIQREVLDRSGPSP